MIRSKLTAKAQTTVPQSVRIALGLEPGDELVYEIEGNRAVLRKASTELEDPFALFTEWAGEIDSEDYADF